MDFFRKSSAVEGAVEDSSMNIGTIKTNIKTKLVRSIKDLQIEFGEGNPEKPIETNEHTYSLITSIESIFIHGLKGQRTSRLTSSRLPDPNFWTFVLVFSHKDTIHQIEKLRAITTDVGKGRAWIRLALNEGLLVSYLRSMIADQTTLRRHYQRHALMRDADTMDVFIRYISAHFTKSIIIFHT